MRKISAMGLAMIAVILTAANPNEEPQTSPSLDGVSAPVYYKGTMLVFTHEKGVAAIIFGDEIKDGVKYRYRYLPNDGKEVAAEGSVFERYKRVPGKDGTQLVDQGGQLYFKAGPARVEWSYEPGGTGSIYYRPEYVRVQIVSATLFDKLDLKRFKKMSLGQ